MTQRLFPDFGPEGLREARLVFEKGPESPSAAPSENTDLAKLKYAEVLKYLQFAASQSGDAKLQALLQNPEVAGMIASQARLPEGANRVDWLENLGKKFAEHWHESFKKAEQHFNAQLIASDQDAKQVAVAFNKALKDMQSPAMKDLPEAAGVRNMLNEKNETLLAARRRALVTFAHELVFAKDDQELGSILKKASVTLKDVDPAMVRILFDGLPDDPNLKRAEFLKRIPKVEPALSAAELETVQKALTETQEKISEEAAKREEILKKLLTNDYLEKLGGVKDKEGKVINPPGFSPHALAIRARLPKDMVDDVLKSLPNVSLGVFIKVAGLGELEKNKAIGDVKAKEIVNILFAKKSPDGKKVLVSEEGAKQLKDEYLKVLTVGGTLSFVDPFKNPTDGKYSVEQTTLIKAISNVQVSEKAAQWIKMMREKDVHTMPWHESLRMYASEAWKLTQVAAKDWTKYVVDMRKIFHSDADKDILASLDRESALRTYQSALNGLQNSKTGTEKFLTDAIVQMQADRKAQDQSSKPLSLADGPKTHIEQATMLLKANAYVIGRLHAEHGWHNRPLRVRQISLWLAMEGGEDGMNRAKKFLQDAAAQKDSDAFVDGFLQDNKRMNVAERSAFEDAVKRDRGYAAMEKADIMASVREAGITLKPRAGEILMQAKLAGGIGRWHLDDPSRVAQSLSLVIEGPAAQALLDAFVSGENKTYSLLGKQQTMTRERAWLMVGTMQTHLEHWMKGRNAAREDIEDEERFGNPVERWMRTGVETLKDMWSGDWVNKLEVAAVVAGGIWLLRKLWKDGGTKGKAFLVGVPLILFANAAYAKKTGRDLLGEKLQWKSKEKRNFPLEQFRRRSAREKQFSFLMQRPGQAAMRILSDQDNPVSVASLLQWREAVKSGGAEKYSTGLPQGLNVSAITDALGDNATKEDGCKMALLTFEALCVDVADLKHLGGEDINTRIERGAKYIREQYVDLPENDSRRALPPATMMTVILDAMHTSSEALLKDRSFLEYLSDATGFSVEKVTGWLKQGLTATQIMGMRAMAYAPELWKQGQEVAFDSSAKAWEWMRVTYPKLKYALSDSFEATWNMLYNTAREGGLMLVQKGPEMVEWTYDRTLDAGQKGKEIAMNTYGMLLANGVTGPILDSLAALISKMWGGVDKIYLEPEHREKLSDAEELIKNLKKQVSTFAHLPADEAYFKGLLESVSAVASGKEKANVSQRLVAFELVKRRVFSFLAAERIHELTNKKNKTPPDATPLVLPLTTNAWPKTAAEFDALRDRDAVYKFLFDNYKPEVVLAAIGNQQTFVGLMRLLSETDPNSTGGKISSILLWPGLEKYFTRNAAGNFLMEGSEYLFEINAYIGNDLREAKKMLSADDFKEYQAYVDTLLANVMFETILSTDLKHVDLRLLKQHAKDFHHHLLMRRGALPKHTETADWKLTALAAGAPSIHTFNISDASPVIPSEIDELTQSSEFRWLLLGEKEPVQPLPAGAPAAPGAAPPRVPTVPLTPTEVGGLPVKADTQTNRRKLLDAMRDAGGGRRLPAADEVAQRVKFNSPEAKPTPEDFPVDSAASAEHHIQYLLGLPNTEAQTYCDQVAQAFAAGTDSDPALCLRRAQRALQTLGKARDTYPGHARLQRVLDDVAFRLYTSLLVQIKAVPTADLGTHPNHQTWVDALTAEYALTSKSPDKYSDLISLLLEYTLYRGDHKTADASGNQYFEKYKAHLTAQGLTPPPAPTYAYGPPRFFGNTYPASTKRMNLNPTSITVGYLSSAEDRLGLLNTELTSRDWD
ncbi:MAG: hypothetical protein PHX87_01640 [Candidatus Peribacteraceae bacterium]|nr:hypothetical protein [Candidatus Peribacteraceae bacterium]MDD5742110.1 hypothetical protein [Candidatus Peribacteraceae bacterium]